MASSSFTGFRRDAVPLNLRLNRSNYLYWRSQVLSTVHAHQLEGFLTGARTRPLATIADPADESRFIQNPELADQLRPDPFLMSWLFNSISEGMLGHLRGLLQSTKKGSTTIEEYILKMRYLGDALMAAGQQITDDKLILYILGGLGNKYDLAIEMRIDQQTSIAALDLHNPTANYAVANKKNTSSAQNNGTNSRGHGSTTGQGGRNYNNRCANCFIFQVCGRVGHKAIKCYHRFNLSYQGENNSTSTESPSDESIALLATASTVAYP
uniref:Retrotransposon Copia-like N-terminal domain-containing protein n=1 Tax=Cannabis sativa TaxID=3483 RepID=A0A803PBD2_CANSA